VTAAREAAERAEAEPEGDPATIFEHTYATSR
jgi:hypothetical protein